MKFRPVLALSGLAAASWAATITADVLNLPNHTWACLLVTAGTTTLAALQTVVVIERNRIMQGLADAALTRPFSRNTAPQAKLSPQPALPVQLDARRSRHARHATH